MTLRQNRVKSPRKHVRRTDSPQRRPNISVETFDTLIRVKTLNMPVGKELNPRTNRRGREQVTGNSVDCAEQPTDLHIPPATRLREGNKPGIA